MALYTSRNDEGGIQKNHYQRPDHKPPSGVDVRFPLLCRALSSGIGRSAEVRREALRNVTENSVGAHGTIVDIPTKRESIENFAGNVLVGVSLRHASGENSKQVRDQLNCLNPPDLDLSLNAGHVGFH